MPHSRLYFLMRYCSTRGSMNLTSLPVSRKERGLTPSTRSLQSAAAAFVSGMTLADESLFGELKTILVSGLLRTGS